VASIVAEHMLLDIDDLSWAKPLVDEARESLARGEGMTLEEHRRNMDEKLAALRRR
jgi:antitoxin ParD1/3/4